MTATQALLAYTPSPQDDLMQRINSIDLDPIKFKLMDKAEGQGWSRGYVDHLASEYRKMLYMMTSQSRVPVVPNKDLDEFWHTHILDTRKYAEDCAQTFGRFVHHFPYLGMRGEEDAQLLQTSFGATKSLYETLFGETYNLRVVQGASDCENCGSCGSSCGVCSSSGTCGGQGKEAMKGLVMKLQGKGGASDCENCGSCASSCGVGSSAKGEYEVDMHTRPTLAPSQGRHTLALVTGAKCDSGGGGDSGGGSSCKSCSSCSSSSCGSCSSGGGSDGGSSTSDRYRGALALEEFLRERHPEIKYD